MPLYNCRHSGDQYQINKFDSDWNVEASYLCDLVACECPAGHRPSCRHRQMLPKFIQREHIGDEWFFDFDRGGWVQGAGREIEPSLTIATEITLPADATPDEVAEAFGNLLAPKMIMEPKTFNEKTHEHDEEQLAFYREAAGLGQVSEPKPYDAFDYTNRDELKNLQQPSSSPTPTIRRRV